MGMDIKYLVVSITAIFISLSIGILIGSNMKSGGFILEQQQLLINSLEEKFHEHNMESKNLSSLNEALMNEIELKDSYLNTFYNKMTLEKLNNINIVVIQTNSFKGDYIHEAVTKAGGNIISHIVIDTDLLNLSQNELAAINNLFYYNLSYDKLMNRVGEELIEYILTDKSTSLINYLLSSGYISFNSEEMAKATPIDKLIITGGFYSPNPHISRSLMNQLLFTSRTNYVDVVGVETTDTIDSLISIFVEHNISTVDNIDSLLGRLSLVLVLNGIEGHYGETEHAYDLLPLGAY